MSEMGVLDEVAPDAPAYRVMLLRILLGAMASINVRRYSMVSEMVSVVYGMQSSTWRILMVAAMVTSTVVHLLSVHYQAVSSIGPNACSTCAFRPECCL